MSVPLDGFFQSPLLPLIAIDWITKCSFNESLNFSVYYVQNVLAVRSGKPVNEVNLLIRRYDIFQTIKLRQDMKHRKSKYACCLVKEHIVSIKAISIWGRKP